MGSEGGPSELGGEVSGDDEMEFTDSEEEERLEKLHPHSKQYRGARVREENRTEQLNSHSSRVANELCVCMIAKLVEVPRTARFQDPCAGGHLLQFCYQSE